MMVKVSFDNHQFTAMSGGRFTLGLELVILISGLLGLFLIIVGLLVLNRLILQSLRGKRVRASVACVDG